MQSNRRGMIPETLQFMLGDFKKDTDGSTEDQSTASVTEISSFIHGTEFIKTINLISDAEAWIHSNNSRKNEKVNIEGKLISETFTRTDFEDFIVLNNDHVYTDFRHKIICCVSSSGVISGLTSTFPLGPVGICAARSGGLLVSVCSNYSDEIEEGSYGEVHHLDTRGNLLRKYPDHGDGQTKLLTCSRRMVQNVNLDLCVVDFIDKHYTSRLVVVTVEGKMRFEYRGQNYLNEIFVCTDVTCDTQGRIILIDYCNQAVHLLTVDGMFIQFLLIEQSGPLCPRSLDLKGDKLWVGCDNGFIKVYILKI